MFRLDDGRQLKLTPVNRYGYWLVAFVVPPQVRIHSATATMSNGQYATAIPVNSGPFPAFGSWQWHGPKAGNEITQTLKRSGSS